MKKIEYKFIKLPDFYWVTASFKGINKINTKRIVELEESFNSLGKDGWELMNIYWGKVRHYLQEKYKMKIVNLLIL